jgi:hypothetical protein
MLILLALANLGDVTQIELILIENANQVGIQASILCHKCHSGEHFRAANAIQVSIFVPQNRQQFQQQT